MTPLRGDVILVEIPHLDGTVPKVRPAVVVQADAVTARTTNTLVASLSTNLSRAGHATHLRIDANGPDGRAAGLRRDSAVNCENLVTIRQRAAIRKIGRLPAPLLAQLDACLKAALGLP